MKFSISLVVELIDDLTEDEQEDTLTYLLDLLDEKLQSKQLGHVISSEVEST